MRGDLHTHSTFSDGGVRADDLPAMAAWAALSHLAVADHDTLAALDWAAALPVRCGVRLVPAVELSAWDTARGRKVHILCYMPRKTPALVRHCARMAASRNRQQGQSLDKLAAVYPFIPRQAVLELAADGGVVYKAHIMRALREYGLTDQMYGALYRKLLGHGGSCHASPEYKPPVEDVLAAAREAGGLVVLAHPGVYDTMELTAELAAAGVIDGVEIDHPGNSAAVRTALTALAKRYDLLITGGSDYHGGNSDRIGPVGGYGVGDEDLKRFLQRLPAAL